MWYHGEEKQNVRRVALDRRKPGMANETSDVNDRNDINFALFNCLINRRKRLPDLNTPCNWRRGVGRGEVGGGELVGGVDGCFILLFLFAGCGDHREIFRI